MKTQLIMLDTPIIVLAKYEKGVSPEVTYFDSKVDKESIYRGTEMFSSNSVFYYITGIKENFRTVKKIIAGLPELPKIDFNGFEEQLGIVDVEKLAYEYYSTNEYYKVADAFHWSNGFKAAQKLNEKKFGLELSAITNELKKITSWDSFRGHPIVNYAQNCIDIINSLYKPKVFDIEVETEDVAIPHSELGDYTGFKSIPKITDNSIKIIKVL